MELKERNSSGANTSQLYCSKLCNFFLHPLMPVIKTWGQWEGPLDLYGKEYDAPALHESPSYG